jgi:uncharacterized membrane protein (UPF0182 family)
MSRRTKIILIPLLLFWGGPKALALYTDWLWFADLGFEEVYRTRLLAQVTLSALGAALFVGLSSGVPCWQDASAPARPGAWSSRAARRCAPWRGRSTWP